MTATTTQNVRFMTILLLDALPEGARTMVKLANMRFVDSTGSGMMLKLKKEL